MHSTFKCLLLDRASAGVLVCSFLGLDDVRGMVASQVRVSVVVFFGAVIFFVSFLCRGM